MSNYIELASRGTGNQDLYSKLIDALLKNFDVEPFKKLIDCLTEDKHLDINHIHDHPHYGTLLDIACQAKNKSKFVQVLIKNGADANLVNETHKKAPLHFAIKYSDLETLECLLNVPDINVNIKDDSGSTALHLACKSGHLEQVKLLLNHPEVLVNDSNIHEKTPVQLALDVKNENIVSKLLEHEDIDIDFIEPSSGKTIRESISERMPKLKPVLLTVKKRDQDHKNKVKKLFFYLRRADPSFKSLIKENEELVNSDDGSHTFLQYACLFGLYDFAESLVCSRVDINYTIPNNRETGLMIACKKGYHRIVSLLLSQKSVSLDTTNKENILFPVIKNLRSEKAHLSGANKEERDYLKCLKEILKKEHLKRLNINQQDSIGNTVLHYAAKTSNQDVIISLLENGAYIGTRNKFDDPPLAYISPKILETYLDRCICSYEELACDSSYEIIFKYNFLVPPKMSILATDVESNRELEMHTLETDPLLYMSTCSKLRPLLQHPVLTSFIHIKWYSYKHLLYCNLVFYALFWLILTIYIFISCHTAQSVNGNKDGRNCTNGTSSDCNSHPTFVESLFWWPLFVFLGLLFLREFFRLFVSPSLKQPIMTVECLLKISIIIVTGMILVGEPKYFRNQISAIGILFSWAELLLLLGTYTSISLSTNIAMFKTVTKSFLKFLKLYFILILAFALSFYLLFQGNNEEDSEKEDNKFLNPGSSILKTIVMMTGEFEYSNIPFVQQKNYTGSVEVPNQAASHVLFVLFVFLMAIVLFNLLNGLAVSDTQIIQKDAELYGYEARVKLISYIERMALKIPTPFQNFAAYMTSLCCCVPEHFRSKTNLFHKQYSISDNYEIHVRPNQENKVILSWLDLDKGFESNSCFANCKKITMEESIVRAANEFLQIRLEETEKNERLAANLEKKLDEYGQRLQNLESITQQSQFILNKILTMTEEKSRKPST